MSCVRGTNRMLVQVFKPQEQSSNENQRVPVSKSANGNRERQQPAGIRASQQAESSLQVRLDWWPSVIY
eukprot:m.11950 g.11950  ORF g.11950 m.11950 type:complete len:69 (+) comp9889_c0_seq7:503-709(+)